MKPLFTFFLFIICQSSFAQDTLYYTSGWKETTAIKKNSNYSVTEYYYGEIGIRKNYSYSGKLQGEFRIENGQRNGFAIWYSHTGKMIESGNFLNDVAEGQYYNYEANGQKSKGNFYVKGEKSTPPPPETYTIDPPEFLHSDQRKEVVAEIIDFPEVQAQYVGGSEAMMKFIQKNVRYPEAAIKKGDHGRVYMSFKVEEDGNLSQIVVERGISPELDAEATRIIQIMPKWHPGESSGKPTATRVRLPILFNLIQD